MNRRRVNLNSVRNTARSYYSRVQRMRNPRAWLAGAGCLLLALIAGCCVVAAAAAFLLLNPASRGALDVLQALV